MSGLAPSAHAQPPRLAGFAPQVCANTRILILGSFPGAASLALGHYYAHPRNAFWPILSDIFGIAFGELPFPVRYQQLAQHGVGLWDVIESCERAGSLDSAIKNDQAADINRLLQNLPMLDILVCNGKTAERGLFKHLRGVQKPWPWRIVALPSTSPAYAALSVQEKTKIWSEALG